MASFPLFTAGGGVNQANTACNGTLTVYGRCEAGTSSCTVPQAGLTCSTAVTFPTAFTNCCDAMSIALTFTGQTTTNQQSSVLGTINTNSTKWAVPVAQTEFRNDTSDRVFVRRSTDISNLQTPTFFFVNVMTAASAGSTFTLQCGTGLNPSIWANLTSVSVASAGVKQGGVATNPSGWLGCLGTTLPATIRVIAFGGDGVTLGTFAQIEVVVVRTFNVTFLCSYTSLSPTGFTMLVTLTFPLPELPQSVPCNWKITSSLG